MVSCSLVTAMRQKPTCLRSLKNLVLPVAMRERNSAPASVSHFLEQAACVALRVEVEKTEGLRICYKNYP